MATSLVSLVMQFLTPDIIARISGALGLDRSDAQAGISAAVPGLLAGLSGVAAQPGGAQNLANAVKQQSGVLDSFAGMIGGGNQSSFIDQGSRLLTSLLGGQDQNALSGAVAKFAGLGQNTSSSLLGMLAPVVMGVIGKQLGGTRGPDAGSLAGLFASQKDQIAQAMPAGFGNLLGGTGLLDSLGGTAAAAAGQAARGATAAAGQATQYASSAARAVGSAGQRAAGAASTPNWLYWVLPLILVAGALWYLLSPREERVAQTPAAPAQTVMLGGVDMNKQLGDNLGVLRSKLQGITDVESARAALPQLQEVTTQVGRVSVALGQLSPEQRKLISGQVAPAMGTLNSLFDKVLAIPGVSEVLQPVIDTLKTRLATLTA